MDNKAKNPFIHLLSEIKVNDEKFRYFNLSLLQDEKYGRLPFSIRILLEAAIRNCDNFQVKEDDVEKILNWEKNQQNDSSVEVPFKPARVILQDFTGVPAVVDFAAMRDAVKSLGGDPAKINPVCPADLVIDHSVQVDFSRVRLAAEREQRNQAVTHCRRHASRLTENSRPSTPSHLQYHRPRSRPTSPHLSSMSSNSLPTPPSPRIFLQNVLTPHPTTVYYPPHSTEDGFLSQNVLPVCPPVPLQPYYQRPVLTYETTPTNFYTGAPYVMIPEGQQDDCSCAPAERPPSRHVPRGRTRQSAGCRLLETIERCSKGLEANAPSLRIPASVLPSPQDIPGIPLQDPICPFHQLSSSWSEALHKNEELEFDRNKERFVFLKWGSKALRNMLIVPPGSGIVHQVNLEYLARVVFNEDGLLFPDSLVGTDSHTTMINGLGVVGWGVGGIEAEAVMLGQAISMVLPKVVGYKIVGQLSPLTTSTDVVLTITKHLRQIGVVGKFVEFFGLGVKQLSLADRATISNMCPEYGATIGFFPVDDTTLLYLQQTNRDQAMLDRVKAYLKAVKMYRQYDDASQDPVFSQIVELNLADVVPSVSGPKRPHDRVAVSDMKDDFAMCLNNKVGFKGFAIAQDAQLKSAPFMFEEKEYILKHGSVVIAAITSCTNTSNPSVMLGAGLLAKKAVQSGLSVAPYIKTSLSPGSGVVTHYLQHSKVTPYLQKLGFDIVGYGCMTCIGNSGPLPESVTDAIEKNNLVCAGVLSGNRNFEGRIHPNTRANYLASPLLVIAYALAGRVDIDFEVEPLGKNADGEKVYLRDIWPSRSDIQEVEKESVLPLMFNEVYKSLSTGNPRWNALVAPEGLLYPWQETSTYIQKVPFFEGMTKDLPPVKPIKNAYVLLNLGDSVTTDHISPAGSIARNSPAARYLAGHGLTPREFNSYGSRRGNDAVMSRGTFANIRLLNKFIGRSAPKTIHFPSAEQLDVFDAAERYKQDGHSVIILAGKEYGSGSSRDWAAKGPFLLGVRAVIAESYERIHRSNLVGMGIVPMQFVEGQTTDSLGLTGKETFSIELPEKITPSMIISVAASSGKSFDALLRFDTEVEVNYFRHGGILNYMIRKMAAE